MLQEIKEQRGYAKEILIDPAKPGRIVQRIYAGPKYYDNKLGLGDGEKGFRKPDTTLVWDETRMGWTFQFHSYQPFIPEFADGILTYRDLFKEKDQTVGFRALCSHVPGKLVPSIEGVTDRNAILYENAYGEGIDLIVAFTFRKMLRLVRIRDGFKPKGDARFSFEIMTAEKILGAKANPGAELEPIEKGITKTERIVVGEAANFHTYINTFRMWDSGKPDTEGAGRRIEIVPITIDSSEQSIIVHKDIPQAFLEKSVGDVFTDDITQYTEDKDTYYGTAFTTGGNPNGTNLAVGGWGDFYYSYLEWDLTSTPGASETTECTFNIKVSGVAVNDSVTTVRRVTSSWTEAGVTLAAHPTDDATTIASMTNPVTIGAGNWDQKSILGLYQDWKDGTYTNYGIKLHSTGNSNAQHNYYSSDQGGSDIPYLEVTYGPAQVQVQLGLEYWIVDQQYYNIRLRGMADAFDITFTHTENEITKGLAYEVASAPTPVDITKALAYAVLTDSDVTKALAYAVITSSEITKGLTYAVLTPNELTKGMAYTVVAPAEVTKALAYTVLTSAEITKALAYAIESSTELTKGLAYAVVAPVELTKGLAYTVIAPAEVTKALAYAILTSSEITKGLEYEIQGTVSVDITKALAYTVITASEITKGMVYAILTASDLTKGLQYAVESPQEVTKGLQYTILTAGAIEKGLAYAVLTEIGITKGLDYAILTENDITKTLAYTVVAPQELTKGLTYSVLTSSELTKALAYAILTAGEVTKGLAYTVTAAFEITKGASYAVLTEIGITKGLEYQVITSEEIQKGLAYTVLTEQAITKALAYAVMIEREITKGLTYGIHGSAEVTRGLEYRVIVEQGITKGLQYRVHAVHEITKGATYTVLVEGGVTKALSYAVVTSNAITKGLQYEVQINPYLPMTSPYTPKTGIYTAKASPFAGKQSPYTGKGQIYTPFPVRH